MFYLLTKKGKLHEITDENVVTTCPLCGRQHHVDLVDVLNTQHADLYGTNVCCKECTLERIREYKHATKNNE